MEDNQNFLVPEHRKIDEEEVQKLLEKFNIVSKLKLPKIKQKDPAISELECEVGDVLVINRTSFAGETKYYRVVVE